MLIFLRYLHGMIYYECRLVQLSVSTVNASQALINDVQDMRKICSGTAAGTRHEEDM